MSILLQLQNGTKSFGARTLFSQGQFAINENEHIGVIGPNGAGKSTLFRILSGQMDLDDGEVVRAQKLRLAYLQQEDHFVQQETIEHYVERQCVMPLWELKRLGRGLGLSEALWQRPIEELSGGFRMRCKLLALIGMEPNLLLLDEPTNYLDLESLLVLERFLLDFKGAFLLISHDREFLRRTTDHTLEIEAGDFTKYNGNIDDYFEQKALLREQLQKQVMSQEAKRQKVLDFAARFGAKATKARQVQSRLKQLDRMEVVELKNLPLRARIVIPSPERGGKVTLQVRGADLGYNDEPVLRDVNMELLRGDHVGVVGVNGAGKSTLLKALAGELQAIEGMVQGSQGTIIGYYAQHVAEALDPSQTVYQALSAEAHREVSPQAIKDLAGSLLFSADDIQKSVHLLSGGEKARVALGRILLKKCTCLLLDEPTNHLDFDTVEALTQALSNYSGTVVAVSHDRGFIRRISRKILEIRDQQVGLYPGSYEEYLWSVEKGLWTDSRTGAQVQAHSEASLNRGGGHTRDASQSDFCGSGLDRQAGGADQPLDLRKATNYKQRRKELERNLRQMERQLDSITASMNALQATISQVNEKLLSSKGKEAQEMAKELHRLQSLLVDLESQWYITSEGLEAMQKELQVLMKH